MATKSTMNHLKHTQANFVLRVFSHNYMYTKWCWGDLNCVLHYIILNKSRFSGVSVRSGFIWVSNTFHFNPARFYFFIWLALHWPDCFECNGQCVQREIACVCIALGHKTFTVYVTDDFLIILIDTFQVDCSSLDTTVYNEML